ncbi:MAG: aspartate carbamoyltransferase catalytic subunit [Shimia sp.]
MSRPDPTSDPWDGILDAGEEITWQGRPDGAWVFRTSMLFEVPFALAFTGFSIFWMGAAGFAGGGIFWLFGLPFLIVGCGLLWQATVGDVFTRRHTWYTLTTRRAFIATDMPIVGRKLSSYPLEPDTRIEFIDGPPDTIHYAEKAHRNDNHTTYTPIGFERIADGRAVLRMMRQVQTDARREPHATDP